MASKYDPKFIQEMLDQSELGRSMTQIAASIGVPYNTFRGWKLHPDKQDFAEAWLAARTKFEAYHEDILQKMAKGLIKGGNAQAQMYILNNRCKKTWGSISTQKIDMTTDVKKLTDKEIEDQIKALLAAKAVNNTSGNTPPSTP